MGLRLFEYAIIQQPLKNKDGKTTSEGSILVGVKQVLAKDEQHVQMLAAREVPDTAMEDLDRLEVVVRPFEREKVLGVATLQGKQMAKPQEPVGLTAYSWTPAPSSSTYTPVTSISQYGTTSGFPGDIKLWTPNE